MFAQLKERHAQVFTPFCYSLVKTSKTKTVSVVDLDHRELHSLQDKKVSTNSTNILSVMQDDFRMFLIKRCSCRWTNTLAEREKRWQGEFKMKNLSHIPWTQFGSAPRLWFWFREHAGEAAQRDGSGGVCRCSGCKRRRSSAAQRARLWKPAGPTARCDRHLPDRGGTQLHLYTGGRQR